MLSTGEDRNAIGDIAANAKGYAALLASILIDLSKGVRSVAIGGTKEFFWIDIDSQLKEEELLALFPHVEEQFKLRSKKGVEIEKLEMTLQNAKELASYLKQTYLLDEIDMLENGPFLEVYRVGSFAQVATASRELSSFEIKGSFQLGLQVADLGAIEDSKRRLFRVFCSLFQDSKSKKEWMKTSLIELYPGHFELGERKGYWEAFSHHILWLKKGLEKRGELEKMLQGMFPQGMSLLELDEGILKEDESYILDQFKSFYTLDYEPTPFWGCDLLPSILNRGCSRTLSARALSSKEEVISLGISFLQILERIHTIVPVKNFKLVTTASGELFSLAGMRPELKDSLISAPSKDSQLCISCAWWDQWGRRWEIARFDACKVKAHRLSSEYRLDFSFRIDWILAIQLESAGSEGEAIKSL